MQLRAAVESIAVHQRSAPRVAIILGSGLGALAEQIETDAVIPFHDIPGFGQASTTGHRGQLILGRLESVPVVVMSGRFHRYEGYSLRQIAFPVHVMSELGAHTLIVSNAAGGLNPRLRVGDLVLIRDHINTLGRMPMTSSDVSIANEARESLRRREQVYDEHLAMLAMQVAIEQGCRATYGTYLATTGPNYETRSEIRWMRRIGADVVGMSTVPEVIAAAERSMRTLGISLVTNLANPDSALKADHADVLQAGRAAQSDLEAIVRGVLRRIAES
jgi:purine-nucleoside phosphorylase